MRDFYEVLGVSRDASADEIKHAYRKKARQLHPDYAGPESEEAFKEVSVAYEVLRDPQKRREYDMGGASAFSGAGAGDNFGFADLFEAMFGSMGFSSGMGQTRARRGQDLLRAVEITLEEVTFGVTKDIRLDTAVVCETCEGSCCAPGTSPAICSTCGGSGSIRTVQNSLLGPIQTTIACQACAGRGHTIPHPCPECAGEGRVRATRTLQIQIPAGVQDGARLRLTGEGEAGPEGGPSGDLYIEIRQKSDSRFSRQGTDLHTRITIPMTTAALGTVFSLETYDGEQEVIIPAGTQPETEIVLKGLGIGRPTGRGRGNLRIHIGVNIPDDLSADQRNVLEQLAQERGETRVPPPDSAAGPLGWLKNKFGA
ncbi:J domain-containing protein [Actinomycetaceae bacterium WB03_NA08]|uniref:Chaperone protein DnaJ n=1 Tax=Scrofimicrobium canadense TaxID=2652290 RepID=A0A6N7W6T2_9ACTO|nr:J domain-containing protein [Scrofimicrobium canadense]MSS83868.1 J domain-containing protein [Scrofimicrobium canadense]